MAAAKTTKAKKETSLLEQWREIAYNEETDRNELQKFWGRYFEMEKGIYQKILADYQNPVTGTVKELSEKFDVNLMAMVGFLDGINDSLKKANPLRP